MIDVRRCDGATVLCASILAGVLLTTTLAVAQTRAYRAPRTADGQPDLQGFWTNATYTPLERPDGVTAAGVAARVRPADHVADGIDDIGARLDEPGREPARDRRLDVGIHSLRLRNRDALVPDSPGLRRDAARGVAEADRLQ